MVGSFLCNFNKLYFYSNRALFSPCVLCSCKFIKSNYYVTQATESIDSGSDFNQIKEDVKKRVIYHSFYKYEDFILQKKKQYIKNVTETKRIMNANVEPVSLKYFIDCDKNELSEDEVLSEVNENKSNEKVNSESVILPYQVSETSVQETADEVHYSSLTSSDKQTNDNNFVNNLNCESSADHENASWMADYDCFEEDLEDSSSKYGTPAPNIEMSNVPCGGCGAALHCQDPGIPGYLPSEIFIHCTVQDLRAITCQRCHFMKHYNTALSVSVDPRQYPRLLSKIKDQYALVILLVDITDFPCSIWPGILDIIGPKRPLFVIGNKVDLLVGDRKGWIRRANDALRAALPTNANIKYSSLISAKTGFGVEELINKLHTVWGYKGDVYLVGCTNVGKSTLFNTLLKSDYCNVEASDLLQRATTAPWPGTTLNLLKFPILRPSGYDLFLRTKRLQEDKFSKGAEKKLWLAQNVKTPVEPIQLVGHIGQTFSRANQLERTPDVFKTNRRIRLEELPQSGLNPKLDSYKESKWLFDTPGVVHSDQIINLLTTKELMTALPKSTIRYRVYLFRENWTVFIGGIGRLDLIKLTDSTEMKSCDFIKIVLFCPEALPVTICETKEADSLYEDYLGTDIFVVPSGGPERLKMWPGLKCVDDIVLQCVNFREACADIVLSNAGWVSIVGSKSHVCKFRCWTPDGRGIHVRKEPLLKFAGSVHGTRMRGTPAYNRVTLKQAIIEAV